MESPQDIRAKALDIAAIGSTYGGKTKDAGEIVDRAATYEAFIAGPVKTVAASDNDGPDKTEAPIAGPIVVRITGPAGSGKTRLISRLMSELPKNWLDKITIVDGDPRMGASHNAEIAPGALNVGHRITERDMFSMGYSPALSIQSIGRALRPGPWTDASPFTDPRPSPKFPTGSTVTCIAAEDTTLVEGKEYTVTEGGYHLVRVKGYAGSYAPLRFKMAEQWIPWIGGDMPVPGDWEVEVKFKGGSTHKDPACAYHWDWKSAGKSGDIHAYRVMKKTPTPMPEPTPPMRDYQPGDVVRRIASPITGIRRIGDVVTIIERLNKVAAPYCVFYVGNDGRPTWSPSDHFELVAKADHAVMFKADDVVECLEGWAGCYTVGKNYIVELKRGETCVLRDDGKYGFGQITVPRSFRLVYRPDAAPITSPVPVDTTRFRVGDIIKCTSTLAHAAPVPNEIVDHDSVELEKCYEIKAIQYDSDTYAGTMDIVTLVGVRAFEDATRTEEIDNLWPVQSFTLVARAEEGWKIWNGGDYPGHRDDIVETVLRGRLFAGKRRACAWAWGHPNSDGPTSEDIVAYRVAKAATQPEPELPPLPKVGDKIVCIKAFAHAGSPSRPTRLTIGKAYKVVLVDEGRLQLLYNGRAVRIEACDAGHTCWWKFDDYFRAKTGKEIKVESDAAARDRAGIKGLSIDKTTRRDFKAGDILRVISTDGSVKVGTEHTVKEIDTSSSTPAFDIVRLENEQGMFAWRFELVSRAEDKPLFPIGSRVNLRHIPDGVKPGTVKSYAADGRAEVLWDGNTSLCSHDVKKLHIDPTPEPPRPFKVGDKVKWGGGTAEIIAEPREVKRCGITHLQVALWTPEGYTHANVANLEHI